jgi:putative ABC transport system permease protein
MASRIPGEAGRASVVGEGGATVSAAESAVSAAYFETLGLPLREGRGFGRSEPPEAVVVGERLAGELWEHASAIGRRLRVGDDAAWRTVVGVVADEARAGGIRPQRGVVYRPLQQDAAGDLILLARVKGVSATSLREALREVEPDAVVRADELAALLRARLEEPAFMIRLLGVFAGLALALATVGVFGVMSQLATERLREIGIRAALGATPRDLARLVVEAAAVRITLGLALGILVTLAGTRAAARELLLVSAPDPWLWLRVAALLSASALAACLVPSLRAARVDPVRLLRHE